MKKHLTAEEVRNFLTYNPDSGKLFWLPRGVEHFKDERAWKIWNTRYAGKEAFTAVLDRGSRNGAIFGVNYLAHRVAWAINYGKWPEHTIDHINGNPSDNRLVNLRDVDLTTQSMNMPTKSNNTTGRVGVTKATNANRWVARINIKGKMKHVGCFKTFEDASLARWIAETFCRYHENHGRQLAY